ncbi:efflux RND transporter periplasmic adaptor subunit [Loktanella fryxellensis]|nr:HlyD family efflux transporter periplasmic adaptor subunit [Loktanella fryxellensis]
MRALRRSLTGLFLLAVTLALAVWAVDILRSAVVARMTPETADTTPRERVFAVDVMQIAPQTLSPVLSVYGEVASRTSLALRAPVGGTVVWTAATLAEGGAVAAGDVVLRIDPATAQAARDRAAADVQDATGEVHDADRGVTLSADELAQAQAQLDLRQGALARAQDLGGRGVGTRSAIEDAELALSAAQSAILAGRRSQAQATARLDLARTALSRAQIALTEAERTLADTAITAPFDGNLTAVTAAQGTRLNEGEAIATLIDPTRLEVAFRLSTAQFVRLLDGADGVIGLPVTAALAADGLDLTAGGTIDRIAGAVGEGQSGRQIFTSLTDAAGFRPGDFVTVSVQEPPLMAVVLLPATAVAADGTVLRVTQGDRLAIQPVDVLRRQGDDVIVAGTGPDGMALNGMTIVTARTPQLGAGIGVRPVPASDAADPVQEAARAVIPLDPDRRARLKDRVVASDMTEVEKARLLQQLDAATVPAATVAMLEQEAEG